MEEKKETTMQSLLCSSKMQSVMDVEEQDSQSFAHLPRNIYWL